MNDKIKERPTRRVPRPAKTVAATRTIKKSSNATWTHDPSKPESLVRLEAYGVNLWGDGLRPVLLLRTKDNDPQIPELTLPVPLNALEAGVTLSQANKNIRPVTIHKAAHQIFQSLNVEILSCIFHEIRAQKQYVKLNFRGHPLKDSLILAAEDAMSLCLYLEIPIYASREFIQQSKMLMTDIEGLSQGLKVGPEVMKRNHGYIQ